MHQGCPFEAKESTDRDLLGSGSEGFGAEQVAGAAGQGVELLQGDPIGAEQAPVQHQCEPPASAA